jgi:3'-phosphoadenosine 5'-phosphosulfate sulfotransferase (PAPS reductase)/FAD synthetase
MNASPNLKAYDYIVINSSSGKDSQAMTDLVVEEAKKQGVLGRTLMVHCDLGEAEWPGAKQLAKEHADHYKIPFIVAKRIQRSLLDEVRRRGKWMSNPQRYCTSYFKRDQVKPLHTRLARMARDDGEVYPWTLDCLGMRKDESRMRAKLEPFKTMVANRNRRVDRWLPLFDWTADDVWARNKAAGTRHHPAYDLGMPRLSCCFCFYAPKAALLLAGKHNPELLQKYVDVERDIGHTFTQKLSLKMVQDEILAGSTCGPVTDWEM